MNLRRFSYNRLMDKVSRKLWPVVISLLILGLPACYPVAGAPAIATPVPGITQTAFLPTSRGSTTSNGVASLTILYTNDEHGWMEGEQNGSGADDLMGLWRRDESYNPQDDFLILSGGDNWTGPAISSWFQGQSMVEVMNNMGYAASTVGNHEFDFGLQNLKQRAGEANFPYLSANIVYEEDGTVPANLGIKPYAIFTVIGVRVGVIGLTTRQTPKISNPNVTGSLLFEDYASALRQYVPQVRAAGADVIIVTSHVCVSELEDLAAQVKELGIAMLGGGHCHEAYEGKSGDTVIVEAGSNYRDYAVVRLTVDLSSGRVQVDNYAVNRNSGGSADETVNEVVNRWHARAQSELNETIGYIKDPLPKNSYELQSLATETWILAYPNAQVALTNLGGFRDRLPAGEVTLAEITSIFPFNNVLVDVALTGEQINQVIEEAPFSTAIGGIHQQDGRWVINSNLQPLDPNAIYHVLVNDFMYAGGDNYQLLAKFDPQAYNTSIDWRQPIIDWIKAQDSSPHTPLDAAITQLGHKVP